jgi:prophage regulatory protein
MESILLRAEEVAELLGLGRTKVFELLTSGELPTVRIGRCVRVRREDVTRWVNDHATKVPEDRDCSARAGDV